jgi:hypothetical protein
MGLGGGGGLVTTAKLRVNLGCCGRGLGRTALCPPKLRL